MALHIILSILQLGLHITPKDGSVHVVGNTTVNLSGSCRLQLKVGKKYCRRVTFYVTKTPVDVPVILGNFWINQYSVQLCDGKHAKMKIADHHRRFIIRAPYSSGGEQRRQFSL